MAMTMITMLLMVLITIMLATVVVMIIMTGWGEPLAEGKINFLGCWGKSSHVLYLDTFVLRDN